MDEEEEAARCARCRKYLDGLTDDAEAHPFYRNQCVACGSEMVKQDQERGLKVYPVRGGRPR